MRSHTAATNRIGRKSRRWIGFAGGLIIVALGLLLWKTFSAPTPPGSLQLAGGLGQSGEYYTLAVTSNPPTTWYIANSQDPKLSPVLAPLVGKQVRLAGDQLGSEGALLIATAVNGTELLSASDAAAFFPIPTFEEFFYGLSSDQKTCLENLLDIDQINDLIAQHAVGIPPEKIEAINQCLVGS